MLTLIRRWLGLKSPDDLDTAPRPPHRARPRSATAHLFRKTPAGQKPKSKGPSTTGGDFNPYNTGKFDRSASWERISKTQR